MIDLKEFDYYQIENKEDLKDLTINDIARSLQLIHGTDLENALLAAHFINHTSRPNLNYLRSNFVETYKDLKTIYMIEEDILKELISILKINQLTDFKENFKLL